MDVCELQETKWKVESTVRGLLMRKGRRYKVSVESRGVSVMVRAVLMEHVCEVNRKSDRVVAVMLIHKVSKAYAPQQGEGDKDNFIRS